MTMIMTIASILLVTLYLGVATWRMRALPDSISALVYVFRHRWEWTLWMWSVAFLTCIPSISALDRIGMGFLGFGTLACLIFCAAMPLFDKDNNVLHWVFGTSGCVLSQFCVLMISPYWLSAWMVFVFIMGSVYVQPEGNLAKAVMHKGVFVAEVVCTVSLMGALLSIH